MDSLVPADRLHTLNAGDVRPDAGHVVYWMTAARRTRFNFGLQRAADWSRELGLPLVVLEALRCDYPWASDRLHRFVLDGMADNVQRWRDRGIAHLCYVEDDRGAGSGLLAALSADAAVVITDWYPTFFIPRMLDAAARVVSVRLESVDSNGLIPLRSTDGEFATAYAFRRHVQKTLLDHLDRLPLEDPLAEDLPRGSGLPAAVVDRWRPANEALLDGNDASVAGLPIDHSVSIVGLRGGEIAARRRLSRFVRTLLSGYADRRNRPEEDATSGLSPYLHFGHVSAHEVFLEVVRSQRWSGDDVTPPANGRRAGWWGLSESVEGFLDQLVTWRELGYQFCHHRPDHERWSSLPDWARRTLDEHAGDPRDHVYDVERFEAADTHDELWNAAQTQLVRDGTMHNYLRMLWGKKILEWTADPRQALDVMLELNNKYALDGRDPNSVSGIFWVLGRHDRPWGPERPIFGKVRYMSSDNTRRKMSVSGYLKRYGDAGATA
jgi:deoxyribodipyrimidine photo-lyase